MSIQTVLGPVPSDSLGRTLTHEHLSLDFCHFYSSPPRLICDQFTDNITIGNVGFIRQYPYSSKYNLRFEDSGSKAAVVNDVTAFRKHGGGTIVENTTTGLNRNAGFLQEVSMKTGVNIIAGSGYYIADMQTPSTLQMNTEALYDSMLSDLTNGFEEKDTVKAGFLGEIASVWPIKDFEKHVIQAAAEVQSQAKCGVSFHPHRDRSAPFEIIRLFLEAGGKADKAVMSHLDRTLLDEESLLEFSALGTFCQLDLFGVEVSYYQLHRPTDMPSDAQRIAKVQALIDEKKSDRILISHDIHTKHRLVDFGGHGYSHIILNVLPKMKDKGISQETIDQITISNPYNWLKQ